MADSIKQVNTVIQFQDNSTNNPTSWSWDFGDGATSTLQNPTHMYTNVGTYTISHGSTNSCGSNYCTNKTIEVTATPPPPPPGYIPQELIYAAMLVGALGLAYMASPKSFSFIKV